ncbi:uncharacterized protein LOC127444560 [Myxocyprinus asiaticus]|uniref:uncharacterized protein LOC127444560 n=1 Tax=Myxocyprinus asiaticus TaxID=70543 RepID=UPI00222330E6|nr:uncharacterized protein LOC127444560 [Myxocyprinus asiaticus]
MKSVLSVKILAVLALVLLASSVSEGRILSKCELKAQLEAALGAVYGNMNVPVTIAGSLPENLTGSVAGNTSLPVNVTGSVAENMTRIMSRNTSVPVTIAGSLPGNLTGSVVGNTGLPGNMIGNIARNLTATIVCTVERTSKFDTSLVKTIKMNHHSGKPPGKPQVQSLSKPNGPPSGRPNEKQDGRPGKPPMGRPGGRGKRSPGKFGGSSDESSEEVSGPAGVTAKLFGIFQLSDVVACDSGSNPSLNICGMNCIALTDDDIKDDIACLKTLMDSLNNVTVLPPPHKKMLELLNVKECRSVNATQYFAECV